ncbi:PH domain-containing protein [Nocardioides sp. TRM66260-LWL]|uniref:PH domain-containing protein n=1 Tax=Nocardioides sp. TRM66260-LWL TaxID=2874478 RepID=UPI001CC71624|nr:PH domain-containing protein [Nocardioides sp. TRM66260-LWL]MBZ5733875.1 PH domain-containing protein [Nocardioides sp. TRM66260-LWL]
MVGSILFVGLVSIFAVTWVTFPPETRAKFTAFQIGTVFFIVGLAGSVILAIVRSKAVASASGLVVVNGYRRRELAWAQILHVRMPQGAPWVSLDLSDGSTLSVFAIQASDGQIARRAVRELRACVHDLAG